MGKNLHMAQYLCLEPMYLFFFCDKSPAFRTSEKSNSVFGKEFRKSNFSSSNVFLFSEELWKKKEGKLLWNKHILV